MPRTRKIHGHGPAPGVEPFLRRIHNMEEAEIYEHYQMSHRTHARVLKTRVADLLDGVSSAP